MIKNYDIRYGFELEGYFDSAWINDVGIESYHSGEPIKSLNNYRLESDGSLCGHYAGLHPAEFISPILEYSRFNDDMDILRSMLKDVRIKTDDTTGLHVNISLVNRNIKNTWTLGRIKKARSEFLEKTKNDRYFRSYAKEIKRYKDITSNGRYQEFNLSHDNYIEWRSVNVVTDDLEVIIRTIKTAIECIKMTLNSKMESETYLIQYDNTYVDDCDYYECTKSVDFADLVIRRINNYIFTTSRTSYFHVNGIRRRKTFSSTCEPVVLFSNYERSNPSV